MEGSELDAGIVRRRQSTVRRLRSLTIGGMSLPDFAFFLLAGLTVLYLLGQATLHPAEVAQIPIFGVAHRAMYALVALGYTIVYGIIELINLAHADAFT